MAQKVFACMWSWIFAPTSFRSGQFLEKIRQKSQFHFCFPQIKYLFPDEARPGENAESHEIRPGEERCEDPMPHA